MTLAPYPTAVLPDGVTVYASPSKSGQPRNAWLAVLVQHGSYLEEAPRPPGYAFEDFGGQERDAVVRRIGNGPWRLVETAAHVWTPTSQRDLPL